MRINFLLMLTCATTLLLLGFLSNRHDAQVQPHTPPPQPQGAGERYVLTIKNVEYPFRWCPAGTFQMGSPEGEAGRIDHENQHTVTLSHDFWLLETEVTGDMWMSVMRYNPSHFNKGAKFPVENVSWDECQEYIKKLNDLKVAPVGFKFALPTEAHWEYACRAGTTTADYFGDSLDEKQANFGETVGKATEVGSYPANAWGLHDMHGNVWEWCSDVYGDYPGEAVTDPTGASADPTRAWSDRVIRGGGWGQGVSVCRSASRTTCISKNRYTRIGFRLALVAEE